MSESCEHFSLLNSLDQPWFKILLAAARDVGPASITLAAIINITLGETFVKVKTIAKEARLPIATVRKHLKKLNENGWICNHGRECTNSGRPRRTCTLKITKKTKNALREYAPLPWFFVCNLSGLPDKRNTPYHSHLDWSCKIVLAVILKKLMSLKAVAQEQGATTEDEIQAWMLNYSYGKFSFSLSQLEASTGLERKAIIAAKRCLSAAKIIRWREGYQQDNGNAKDLLLPNWDFRIAIRPAGPGRVFISLTTVKSGEDAA